MSQSDVLDKPKITTDEKTEKPKMYVVLVHNDPFTPRGFVVEVLQRYFQKNGDEAAKIMMRAHTQGMGAVGVYTFEIAETKTEVANSYSREQGYPLFFSVEEE
jgi:ATP-dependent Clp protease adaptor protein ClpS